MASLTWFGTKDDSFNDVKNWRNASGATPGAVPANTDRVYFTRRALHPCRTGMDQGAKNFAVVVVEAAYGFNLGTGQAPLKCSSDAVSVSTSRSVFLEEGTGVFDDFTIAAGLLSLRNSDNASGIIRLHGGILRVVGSGTRVLGELTVDGPALADLSGTLTTLRLNDGSVTMREGSTLTTATVDAGALHWHGDTFTTLVQNAGTVFDNSTAPPATVTQRDGLYTFGGNKHGQIIDLNTHDVHGGILDLRTGHGNVGMAGGTLTFHTSDAQLFVDPRRKLTYADA